MIEETERRMSQDSVAAFRDTVKEAVRQEELQAEVRAFVDRAEEAMRGFLSPHPDGYVVCIEGPVTNLRTELDFSNATHRRPSYDERKALEQGPIVGTHLHGYLIVRPYKRKGLEIDYRPSRYGHSGGGDFEIYLYEQDLEIIGDVAPEEVMEGLSRVFDEEGRFERDSRDFHAGEVLTFGQFEDKRLRRVEPGKPLRESLFAIRDSLSEEELDHIRDLFLEIGRLLGPR